MNKIPNLSLFLQGRVYFCKANDNVYKCTYFAPCFGNQISVISPGIKVGLSYIAGIEKHLEVKSFNELVVRNKKSYKKNKLKVDKIDDMLLQIKKDEKYNEETSLILLLLGKPRMLFNPPIEKENLQKGKGWLSKKYYECEELFNAAKL